VSLPYPLDHYYRLLEESSRLFLLLLVVASLVLLATLALCAVAWYALTRRCGSDAGVSRPTPPHASASLSRSRLCRLL
jgi:hypothetical protein